MDTSRVAPDRVIAAVSALGYTPRFVEEAAGEAADVSASRIDSSMLPPDLSSAFVEARDRGACVLLVFSGKG